MRFLKNGFAGIGLSIALLTGFTFAGEETKVKREKRANESVQISVKAWGPTQEQIDAAKLRVERSPAVQKQLTGTRYRLLEFNYIENENKSRPSQPPTRFRVVFYDYTNDRTLVAESDFAATEPVTVREEFYQPTPNDEEFDEALRILGRDARFGAGLRGESLRASRPMPPTTVLEGTRERLINIGIEGLSDSAQNEIVGVSISRDAVVRYPERAPDTARSNPDSCGIPSANQGTTQRGTAGQYQLTVSQAGTTIWEMLVIRPSASSGTMASGIEIRDVKYLGKSVLKRGHAPVLNVEYTPANCGPYRDWQYSEGFFQAPAAGATDPAPGIRVLADGQIATTSLETGNDAGNFRGVAIYKYGKETVMVSEMDAGWYRYIMEWRFSSDGTILPRYGFGATNNSCVCSVHNHHVYWRLDFDVVSPTNRIYQIERGFSALELVTNEFTRLKNLQASHSFMIQNSSSNEAYTIAANATDGVADTYGRSDWWILKYKNVPGGTNFQNEIDDGWSSIGGQCTPTSGSCINITPFLNNESVVDQDVVVWYGAHFVHSDGANLLNPDRSPTVLSGAHVVGPDIRPVRW